LYGGGPLMDNLLFKMPIILKKIGMRHRGGMF